jgi:hypothetical protein
LPSIEMRVLNEPANCENCEKTIPLGAFVSTWDEAVLCSQPCLETFVAERVGLDFIAAQDQAVATVTEVMKHRPRNFVLFYESEQDGEYAISTVVMAHPQFAAACLPILLETTQMQGTIEPPPELPE